MTSVILLFIRFVLRVPLRMSEEDLLVGDDAVHGEDAYAFGDSRRSLLRGDIGRVPINGDGELGIIHGENGANDSEISPAGKKGDL